MRRPSGTGQIEVLRSGKARVRLGVAGKRRTFGPFNSEDDARESLPDILAQIASGKFRPLVGRTLEAGSQEWLDQKESESGSRDMPRRGALKHIKEAPFAKKRMNQITRGDVLRWAASLAVTPSKTTGKPLAPATRRLIISTLCCIYQKAIDEERVTTNPALKVRIAKNVTAKAPWSFLRPEQQLLLLDLPHLAPEVRLPIQFAIGTGLRSGEQWALEQADVHLGKHPHVVVRYGGPKHSPTKSRKIRKVPLFGKGLEAALEWKKLLPSFAPKNPLGLFMPTATGAMRRRDHPLGRIRRDGKRLCIWKETLAEVFGADFKFRWHDLRHTCGSSLISGWWNGKTWRIEQVRDFLGHSSVKQTERYAHLAESDLQAHAEEGETRSPREAHALGLAAKQDVLVASEHEDVVDDHPGSPGGYADSWDSGGLGKAVLDALRAIERREPLAEEHLTGLSAAIVRDRVMADPIASAAVKAAETSGAFKADRFVDAASAFLSEPTAARKRGVS